MPDINIPDGISAHMTEFLEYCAKFGKTYATREETMLRLKNYFVTDAEIKQAMVQINENNKGRKEKDKLKLAHNKWSDWSKEEKSNKNGGGQRSKKALMESRGLKPELENNQPLLPESG